MNKLLKSINNTNNAVSNFLSSEQVIWKFLPPHSPNFQGLWERGAEQFKYLKRTIGVMKLMIEEFLTITTQIEGILNSPLFPLSSGLEDYDVLIPGHFLIGRPINALSKPRSINGKENLLDR